MSFTAPVLLRRAQGVSTFCHSLPQCSFAGRSYFFGSRECFFLLTVRLHPFDFLTTLRLTYGFVVGQAEISPSCKVQVPLRLVVSLP